jgi:hypothetical protein
VLIDKALTQGLRPVAARGTSPPPGRLVFVRPSVQGQAEEALARRRSRQPKLDLSAESSHRDGRLQIAVGTVKSRSCRAHKRLATELGHLREENQIAIDDRNQLREVKR